MLQKIKQLIQRTKPLDEFFHIFATGSITIKRDHEVTSPKHIAIHLTTPQRLHKAFKFVFIIIRHIVLVFCKVLRRETRRFSFCRRPLGRAGRSRAGRTALSGRYRLNRTGNSRPDCTPQTVVQGKRENPYQTRTPSREICVSLHT